jgi:ribosomal protein L24
MEMPIHISNVAFCDDEGSPLKVRVSVSQSSGKELVAKKKGGEEFVLRTIRSGSKAGQ